MLQTRTIEPRTLALLKELMSIPIIKPFYLVGGTALALQMGHRVSIDLDLFTTSEFDKVKLIDLLTDQYEVLIENEGKSMIISLIEGIKVDFVKMSYPILFPTVEIEQVRMLNIRDIAPMKIKAVVQRGSKKDFYDIFYLLDLFSLEEMLDIFKQKFTQHEIFYVIKSLTYFEDAEAYPDPILFDKKISWKKVKETISKEVKNLLTS